jgi:hypothetical protein
MLARRLLILLAVLMGLTALAAGVAPRRPLPPADGPSSSPEAATAAPAQRPLERTLSADEPSSRKIVVRRGRLVRLTIEGDIVDSVQIGELAVLSLDPDSPVQFELIADEPGSYPITLVDAQRRLGVVEVEE